MKKQEFISKRRIFSLLLTMSMISASLPMQVMAESEDVADITSYQLDLSDKFNYSNWGIEGETVTNENFINAAKGGFIFATANSMKDSFVLNDEITFTFDTSTASADVNNFYRADATETAVFTGHVPFAKTVYMGVTLYTNSSAHISPVITYTDGTVDTQTIFVQNKAQITAGSEPASYAGCIDATKADLGNKGWRYAHNEDGTIIEKSSSDGLPFYAIDVDETKTIESISIANSDSYQVAYYAIGGTVMSNAELLSYVENVEAYEVVTDENKAEIITAKAYADELLDRNAVSESDVEKINTLYAGIDGEGATEAPTAGPTTAPTEVPTAAPVEGAENVYQLDLSDKFNYSNWGIEGETVTSTTFENAAKGGFIFATANSMKDSFALNDEMTFTFDAATASANVNNFYRADATETAVFTGHAPFAKTVYMGLTLYTNSSAHISPVITYTDGTVDTQTIFVQNKAQIAAGSEPASYAGCLDATKVDFGNMGWKYANNVDGVITASASSDGLSFYAIDVDETKTIESIAIANSDSYQVAYYAIGGTVMSNAELLAYVENVKAYDAVTDENKAEIITAKAYADELIERNAVSESDVEKINTLYAGIEGEEPTDAPTNTPSEEIENVYQLDLSDKFNYSNWGIEGETVTSETFINAAKGGFIFATANSMKDSFKLNDEMTFTFDTNTASANVNNFYRAGATETAVFTGYAPFTKTVYMGVTLYTNSSAHISPVITYTDGTVDTQTIFVQNKAQIAAGSEPASYAGCIDATQVDFGNMGWKCAKNDNGTIVQASSSDGLPFYAIDVDETKTIESIAIANTDSYQVAYYAIGGTIMSNAELLANVDGAKDIDLVRTAADAETVKKAWACAKELDRREVVKLSDNAFLGKLVKQAEAQEEINVDITAQLDTDLIVNVGDSRPGGYNGRDDALIQAMGNTVTLVSPRDENYIDKDAGRSFTLSGGYDGNGNDSVKVGTSSVKFDMGDKLLTRVSFLVDCIDTKVSRLNGGTVKAVITYTDGTTEEVRGQLRRSDTWYTNQYGAFATITYAHYDEATGLYADGRVSVEDESDKYCLLSNFGFDISTAKTVASVELMGGEYTYYVFGVNAVPYTNAALEENLAVFETVTGAADVNESNAKTALLGASSALELHARGYELDSESLAMAREVYTAALMYISGDTELSFKPSLTVENGTATVYVTMTNTTTDDATYVMIITAYDSNNELVGMIAGKEKTLYASTPATSDSITLTKLPSNAVTYKAMVWDGLKTMKPYAVAETK